MWSGGSRSVNFGHSEMGMVGLRDVFVVAPASSYHNDVVMPDPHIHGVGVIPLLTAAPCLDGDTGNMLNLSTHNRSRSGGIQLWQDHYLKKQGLPEHNGTTSSGNLAHSGGGPLSGSALSSGGTTCQDCGNQAKKDCSHRRCRTCCKSRGYDCPTHVKSTWVPAARRRERQLMASAAGAGGGGSSGATSISKKPKLVASQTTTTSRTSTSNTTRSFDTSSSHQDASFKDSLPGQVRAPAVFKCVRVTAVDDGGDDEYAYQAVVKIGGHVFKGFLYDQGVENGEGYPNISELHLGGGGGGGTGASGGRNGATSSSTMLDPSDVYAAASCGGFLAGSTYGNAMN
ncbi:protein LATERAL ROOT PRIMORDIUM 1-like [Prosopis cineraria]|uniref:protein LATERAL ROOT PRIMORDIUM 1-like n=1 Tax=Prosopis cineraria TaxID=364024 RepID=UPI00240F9E6F|nr:protein LATERAL ROOT PRIMORDIUM 1-like [Prosopis cineraria]XP_054799763.1 protein LATERAL ROOT PRIMORDIUM 1-like [Prosopis cineraria]XP_054799764.1 protein LATERAL ROOT PRIMORDIUM 1-like [Prosopis cineraria]XP_054799765.1 protein LATERAL ROOT PRIMORDIUM 1-like [Prosopis cineraria]